ncbi:hypothetical protein FYK55_14220 [Roseiconus nitratireducens]|uniref:Uncharacterized protein n=1 Tax=Roseiconus nitratireducens TaxID=2605748 RepID=A0A5M6D5A5_9BACT|nr:hypothetical protein [Roseiconus nitratireducens]KAA5542684.1 hypothetical protein FYK55_14220 [Roseiconus nitratireducens]
MPQLDDIIRLPDTEASSLPGYPGQDEQPKRKESHRGEAENCQSIQRVEPTEQDADAVNSR